MGRFPSTLWNFHVRLGIYAALEAVALQAIVVTGATHGPDLFKDNGPIEWVQFGLTIATALVFLWNRRANSATPYPSVLLLCSLFVFSAAVRELDHFSDTMLFRGTYKYAGAAIGGLVLYHLWKDRQRLWEEISAFMKEAPFFFLAIGFFLVAIAAQLLGQQELWQPLLATSSAARTAKITVEETIEALGYLILFFGAIETCFLKGNSERKD